MIKQKIFFGRIQSRKISVEKKKNSRPKLQNLSIPS